MPATTSYGFFNNEGDDFAGLFDTTADKLYQTDYGYKVPCVKATLKHPNWMSDNDIANILKNIGAQVISVDGRPANDKNVLQAATETILKNVPTATLKSTTFNPRRVRFSWEDGTSCTFIVPLRKKLKDTLQTVLNFSKGKRAITGIRLFGEQLFDFIPMFVRDNEITLKKLTPVKRWNSLQTDDVRNRNANYSFIYQYWSDLGQKGNVNELTVLTSKVSSQKADDGSVPRPAMIAAANYNRLMKISTDKTAELRRKFCKERQDIDPRKLVLTFAVKDDSEGLSAGREFAAQIQLPISWWDDGSAVGNDGIKNAMANFFKNQSGLICAHYYGESNRNLHNYLDNTFLFGI